MTAAATQINEEKLHEILGKFVGDLGATLSAGTMSIWVRTDTTSSERGAFCAGASGGGSSVYFSFMKQAQGQIRVDLDDGSARRDAQGGPTLATGQWYHVATTWAANGTLRLYIDGLEVKVILAHMCSIGLAGV